MKHDFSEKVVLISGGTSGIGLAAARQFIAAGALVALVGRDLQRGGDALVGKALARGARLAAGGAAQER